MAMMQGEFDELVARLERAAASDPRAYHIRLGAFAALGYLYVTVILLLLVVLVGGLIASVVYDKGPALIVAKLVIPVVVLIGLVARSLWVRLDAPRGLEVDRSAYPRLFELIDEVRAATRAPRAHVVLLSADFNAAVVQVPRLGLFGWQRNYLLLGLPLMQQLSIDEFKAVLAHEFGHLSGAHGRFGAWIYRVRVFWDRIATMLQQEQHWGSFLFVPFFSWYAPKFAAWSFVKARQQEYEADRLAAETIGARNIASALVRIQLKGEELNTRFWPGIFAAAADSEVPTAQPYRSLATPERRRFLADAPRTLERVLARNTSTADTHPCLRERIVALAADAVTPDPADQSAAEVLFGPALDELIQRFDQDWSREVEYFWRERHAFVAKARERLAALDKQELDESEMEERAHLVESVHDGEQALPLWEALLRRNPGHVGASLASGRLLLARGDEAGIPLVEYAMKRDAAAILPGCDAIVGYLHAQGRDSEARDYIDRFNERHAHEQHVLTERQVLRTDDSYGPHGMPREMLDALLARIAANPAVKRAYLVRKECRLSHEPLYVVGFDTASLKLPGGSSASGGDIAQALAASCDLAVEIFFLPLNAGNRGFRKVLKKVPNSLVFKR